MNPVPALLQMSHGEFFTASQSPGEAVKKTLLYLGAGTAQTDSNCCDSESSPKEREGRYVHHRCVTTG